MREHVHDTFLVFRVPCCVLRVACGIVVWFTGRSGLGHTDDVARPQRVTQGGVDELVLEQVSLGAAHTLTLSTNSTVSAWCVLPLL